MGPSSRAGAPPITRLRKARPSSSWHPQAGRRRKSRPRLAHGAAPRGLGVAAKLSVRAGQLLQPVERLKGGLGCQLVGTKGSQRILKGRGRAGGRGVGSGARGREQRQVSEQRLAVRSLALGL